MKLSDRFQYTVLCEDSQMRTFIVSFLKAQGIGVRKIRVVPIPDGIGCGEAHVRNSIVHEIDIMHIKNSNQMALVVCQDADNYTCEARKKALLTEILKEKPGWKKENEYILIWIPKREIETWIAYFEGKKVDENMEFRHGGNPVSCKEVAQKMFDFCQPQFSDNGSLPSLSEAKKEYLYLCKLQDKNNRL